MSPRFLVAWLIAFSLVGAACSSSSSDGAASDGAEEVTTTEPPPPTAESVLADAADAMQDVESLAFEIAHEGAPVFIDPGSELIEFGSATGRFDAPASADALVAVSALGLDTEVGAVAIDGDVWITNPLTGSWEEAPEAFSFDPARIFDPEVGLRVILSEGLIDPQLDSIEPDSSGRYLVTGGVEPERIATLTSGLIDDVSDVQIWIDAETNRISQVRFAVEVAAGDTFWDLTLTDYDKDISIEAPELG